jgi:hypothetical protein
MRLFALLLALCLAALPVSARPLTPEEDASLGKAVDAYLKAILASNAEKIVAAIPPRVVNIFAGTAGIEAKKVQKALVDQTKEMMKGSRFRDLSADRSALDAGEGTLSDGTAITWVIVPTAFTAEVGEAKTRNNQPVLALSEGGKWYFLRIDGEQQKQLVTIAYPFLEGVSFPAASATPIQ